MMARPRTAPSDVLDTRSRRMTAVEVLSMTQPPYARLLTGRLPCIPCRRPWGIVAERLHAVACRALGSATRAPRPPPSDQREGLCIHPHDALRMGLWCDLAQQ